jgi:glutathione S-transferase
MLLASGGIDYDDIRYSSDDFQKGTAPTPLAADPTGGSRYPFNQMPALEIDGVMYAQTSSIARFAARLVGLYPAGLEEALKSDEIFEHTAEMQYSTTPIFMDGVPGRAGTKMRSKVILALRVIM